MQWYLGRLRAYSSSHSSAYCKKIWKIRLHRTSLYGREPMTRYDFSSRPREAQRPALERSSSGIQWRLNFVLPIFFPSCCCRLNNTASKGYFSSLVCLIWSMGDGRFPIAWEHEFINHWWWLLAGLGCLLLLCSYSALSLLFVSLDEMGSKRRSLPAVCRRRGADAAAMYVYHI